MSTPNLVEPEPKPFAFASFPEQRTPESEQTLNLDAVVHNHIHFVLGLNRGNKLKTARQLGISRSTLYRILDRESER
jgi:ActR/RegA family two-component response regulator